MNVSKHEQRTLHALAQGGHIKIEKNDHGKAAKATCFTREGFVLADCSLGVFKKLRKRKLIRSRNGAPYRITRAGLEAVRAQLDNR